VVSADYADERRFKNRREEIVDRMNRIDRMKSMS
jgi:hypothetical protein